MKSANRPRAFLGLPILLVSPLLILALRLSFTLENAPLQHGAPEEENHHRILNESIEHAAKTQTIQPIVCDHLIRNANTTDEKETKMFLRYTLEDPRFWIALHSYEYDKTRWSIMDHGKYYEQVQTAAFVELLTKSKNSVPRVIDVGGNIGWFSLLSASVGAKVDVFEPNRLNYMRMCESICMNNFGRVCEGNSFAGRGVPAIEKDSVSRSGGSIDVFPAAVGSRVEKGHLGNNNWNPGMGSVMKDEVEVSRFLAGSGNTSVTLVDVVSLDMMAAERGWYDAPIDILKVDVEGFEREVFLGGKGLLDSHRIENIFMEGDVDSSKKYQNLKKISQFLVDAGYELYKIGGFAGPAYLTELRPSQEDYIEQLVYSCRKGRRRKPQRKCNMWWKVSAGAA